MVNTLAWERAQAKGARGRTEVVGESVPVGVGVGVELDESVPVGVGEGVGVAEGDGVSEIEADGEDDSETVADGEGVGEPVPVGVGEGVELDESVPVGVGEGVGVAEGDGEGETAVQAVSPAFDQNPASQGVQTTLAEEVSALRAKRRGRARWSEGREGECGGGGGT